MLSCLPARGHTMITNDLLEKWYDYSNAAEEAALREWCADNGVELKG